MPSMSNRCHISIVVPVFNEAQNLAKLLDGVQSLKLPDTEVIVVDDGSTDGSSEVAEKMGARVLRHPYNIGNGAAVKTGLRAARGKILVLMDGDGQYRPEDIPKLLADSERYHMVVGARAKGSRLRFHRYAANIVYNLLASYVTKFRVKDLTSGFRVLSRVDALRFIDLLPNTFSCRFLTINLRYRVEYFCNFWFVPGAFKNGVSDGSIARLWEEYCH